MPGNPADGDRTLPHIDISERKTSTAYSPVTPPVRPTPQRADYVAHAAHLLAQLSAAFETLPQRPLTEQVASNVIPGVLVEVETMPPRRKVKKVPDLDFAQQDIQVLQTHLTEASTEVGVLFVPDRSREFLKQRVRAYGAANLGNRPRPYVAEFEVVETVRPVGAEALFVGTDTFETEQPIWWEFWVMRDGLAHVRALARYHCLDVQQSDLLFPDVGIVFIHAASAQVRRLVSDASGRVVEIRKAIATPEVMLDNGRLIGQTDWVDDLVRRMVTPAEDAPAVCIHDTGIAAAHPLVAPGLRRALAYDDAWGTDDHE